MHQSDGNQSRNERGHIYQLRIRGAMRTEWQEWFDGLVMTVTEDGDTLLTGPIQDQAALFGLLHKVRNLGIPLISLMRVDDVDSDAAQGREPE